MSMIDIADVRCGCGNNISFKFYRSVNIALDPELKNQILDRSINYLKCGKCGYEEELATEFLYHDMKNHVMIWVIPEGEKESWCENTTKDALRSYYYGDCESAEKDDEDEDIEAWINSGEHSRRELMEFQGLSVVFGYDGLFDFLQIPGQSKKASLTQVIPEFNKAIEINPDDAEAYYSRGVLYYLSQEYDKAWVDVHKAEKLGYTVNPKFLDSLKQESGRDK
jgi:hypothetical protein